MCDEDFFSKEQKKNAVLISELVLLSEVLIIYQDVLNAVHGVSTGKLRKLLENFVTS